MWSLEINWPAQISLLHENIFLINPPEKIYSYTSARYFCAVIAVIIPDKRRKSSPYACTILKMDRPTIRLAVDRALGKKNSRNVKSKIVRSRHMQMSLLDGFMALTNQIDYFYYVSARFASAFSESEIYWNACKTILHASHIEMNTGICDAPIEHRKEPIQNWIGDEFL